MVLCETSNFSIFTLDILIASDLKFCFYSGSVYLTRGFKVQIVNFENGHVILWYSTVLIYTLLTFNIYILIYIYIYIYIQNCPYSRIPSTDELTHKVVVWV